MTLMGMSVSTAISMSHWKVISSYGSCNSNMIIPYLVTLVSRIQSNKSSKIIFGLVSVNLSRCIVFPASHANTERHCSINPMAS